MILTKLKHYFQTNIWLAGGIFLFGLFCFNLSDSNHIIELIIQTFPLIDYEFMQSLIVSIGSGSMFLAFYTLMLWLKHQDNQHLANRKTEFDKYVQTLGWQIEKQSPSFANEQFQQFRSYRNSIIFKDVCLESFEIENFISKTINDNLFLIADYRLTTRQAWGERDTFVYAETAFLMFCEKRNLPLFQLEAKHIFNQPIFNNKTLRGNEVEDYNLPQYPIFANKYILNGESKESILKLLNPEIIAFFEANNFYRVVGKGKMIGIITLQTSTINQSNINQMLDNLRHLHNFLGKN